MAGAHGRLLRALLACGFLALAAFGPAGAVFPARAVDTGPVPVSVRAIDNFRIGLSETMFGPLEFVGGLEMRAPGFGSMSAFRFLSPGGDFIGVADTGLWFFGRIERDAALRPVGIADLRTEPMLGEDGKPFPDKRFADAEGLDVEDGIATVGFEREHRVAQYRIDPAGMGTPLRKLDFLVPKRELRRNRGFETVVRAHPHGRHEGGLVVISEKSIDKAGNIFAAIIEGPNRGVFTVRRDPDFDITDGALLPNGDILILERSFTLSSGLRMRLRRLYGESIARGAVADGPVLFSADMGYQIDNMEGMDVWRRADGATMVSLVSDDNQSILQRNLYLEFRLHED